MNTLSQRKFSSSLSIILGLFTFIYGIGVFYLFLSWIGVQSYDPGIWQHDSLPFYVLVFLIALIGLFGIWRGKKWGVYCLAGSWALIGVLNSVFIAPTPFPYRVSFLANLLVVTFFLLLLPAWKDMD